MKTSRGDTEKQALLRDKLIKEEDEMRGDPYIPKIDSVLRRRVKLLDIGCGTGHIIQELAISHKSSLFVGLDISSPMLKVASANTVESPNVIFVEGDGLKLPFPDQIFDVVITRLAEYSPREAYRVLKKGGDFFEYGLGPEADKEIAEFFPERIELENFFFPKNLNQWEDEVCENIEKSGFVSVKIETYKEADYYQSEEELMNLIELVPLVKDFDRKKDRRIIDELAQKYRDEKGIKITWHYYIVHAFSPIQ